MKKTPKYVQFKKKIFHKKKMKKKIFVKSCRTTIKHNSCLKRGKCSHRIISKHNLCSNKTKRRKL